jgi:glycosyltransferase involved in cell wall biosynthesis
MGGRSEIYAHNIHPDLAGQVLTMATLGGGSSDDVIVYHASIGDAAVTSFLLGRPERLVVVYHNISPADPFRPYDPSFAALLESGRHELAELRARAALALGVSEFNAADLRAMGFRNVSVAPLIVDAGHLLEVRPDPATVRALGEIEGPVVLFVGQFLPHKQPHVLLAAYHVVFTYLNPDCELFFVGPTRLARYREVCQSFIEELNLDGCGITGAVSEAKLAAYYRRADLFVTLSEHEGFCVPLLEAMAFGVPIVARRSAAIPETLGDAGFMIDPSDGPMVAAEAIYEGLTNPGLRRHLVERGRRRLEAFDPARSRAILRDHLLSLS